MIFVRNIIDHTGGRFLYFYPSMIFVRNIIASKAAKPSMYVCVWLIALLNVSYFNKGGYVPAAHCVINKNAWTWEPFPTQQDTNVLPSGIYELLFCTETKG